MKRVLRRGPVLLSTFITLFAALSGALAADDPLDKFQSDADAS